MNNKITSRFFTVRRHHGGFLLNIRGRQVASIYRDGASFWAVCPDTNRTAYDFGSFAEADAWAWLNYA